MSSIFWKPSTMKLGIILKSGKEIIVVCKDAKWTYRRSTGTVESYELSGVKGPCPKFINVNEIAAIVRYN